MTPTRTIYVKPEHQDVWNQAKELLGDDSLSELVAEGLKKVVEERKAEKEGFKRVEVEVGTDEQGWITIAFQGRLLVEDRKEGMQKYDDEEETFFEFYFTQVYLTPKGNIIYIKGENGHTYYFNYHSFEGFADHRLPQWPEEIVQEYEEALENGEDWKGWHPDHDQREYWHDREFVARVEKELKRTQVKELDV